MVLKVDFVLNSVLKSSIEVHHKRVVIHFEVRQDLAEFSGILPGRSGLAELKELLLLVPSFVQVAKGFLKTSFEFVVVAKGFLNRLLALTNVPLFQVFSYS